MNWKTLLLLSIFATLTNGYKVLLMGPYNGPSHLLYLQTFAKALLNRGHEVTFLTSKSMGNFANYTEVLIDPPFDIQTLLPQTDLQDSTEFDPIKEISVLSPILNEMNAHALESPNVQKFIHSTGLHFDIIINEEFFGDSFLMFAHKFKAPIIAICSLGITNGVDENMGLITPMSIAPHWMLPYTDSMTFYQRWYNAIVTVYDYMIRHFVYLPREEALMKKHFAHLEPLPSMNDLLKRISVTFVNSHRSFEPPRPAMPGTINIGGAHVKLAKPLPEYLQKFLDESTHGVIYFSLGSVINTSKLPNEKIQAFLECFKGLKQNVLWKFENESLNNVPPNVMVKKWLPQNDILAHPNVVLFITHGGLFGTTESLYHGIPLLVIPFFGDQHRNAHRIESGGYGKSLDFSKITKKSFSETIEKLISDKSYLNKAKMTSAIFKDNIAHPMDEAMFWIEHVAKFKGSKHLKSHAVHMSWFTYFSIDILIANILVILTVISVVILSFRKLFARRKVEQKSGKKQN